MIDGQASKEEFDAGEARLVRLINYDAWERWIAVKNPLPHVLVVPKRPRLSDSFLPRHSRKTEREERLVFRLEEWSTPGFRTEPIYLEEGALLDEGILSTPQHPSIHREREWRNRYERLFIAIKAIVDEQRAVKGAFAEAVVARDSMDRVERLVRQHEASEKRSTER